MVVSAAGDEDEIQVRRGGERRGRGRGGGWIARGGNWR